MTARHFVRVERLVPDHPQRGADDLDAGRLRDLVPHARKSVFPLIGQRSTARARRSRMRSTRPRRCAQEADKVLEEYRERLKEARAAGRGDRRARAQGGRGPRARGDASSGRPSVEEALEQTPPRHRGRDARRDRRDPPRGRRPDRDGHREGHAQDADRRRSAPARRGGARRARLLALTVAERLVTTDGRDRPGLCPRAVRGRPRAAQRST